MLVNQRTISRYEKFLLYFKSGFLFIGEACVIAGFVCFFKYFKTFETELLIGFLAFVPAYFLIKHKVNNLLNGTKAIEYGENTIASISNIENTFFEHNERTVKEYTFQFLVNGKIINYTFSSAYHRHLELNMKFDIYYLPEDPSIAVIPALFGLKLNKK